MDARDLEHHRADHEAVPNLVQLVPHRYAPTPLPTAPITFSIAGQISLGILFLACLGPIFYFSSWFFVHELEEHFEGKATCMGRCCFCLSRRSMTFWFLVITFFVI